MNIKLTNQNYCAMVVEVKSLKNLEWCDNILWAPLMWYQAIVSTNTKVWDIGILFWPETELSHDFCYYNNLYRDSSKNRDTTITWYVEHHKRVKAVKLRWHKSNSLFMPIHCLFYVDFDESKLNIWDMFNEINDVEICKKFIPLVRNSARSPNHKINDKHICIDKKMFPEHIDTVRTSYMWNKIKDDDFVYVTQKLHGTSIRFWNCISQPKLPRYKSLACRWFGLSWSTYMEHVWSHHVIKTEWGPTWYYKEDIRSKAHKKFKWIIPKDWVLYWEMIWPSIQKNYWYSLDEWEYETYIYRITTVNANWITSDLSREWVKEFCRNNNIKHVPELWKWFYKNLDIDLFMDIKFHTLYPQAVVCDKASPTDEWIIIRKEWIVPFLAKSISSLFFNHETKMIDAWEYTIE
jgi:hypothetical protein